MTFAPDRGRELLTEVVERWWVDHAIADLSKSTRNGYLPVWANHIEPELGRVRVRDLTPGRVDAFRLSLEAKGVGAPTAAKALAILSGVMRYAVIRGLVDRNPVREVRTPRARRERFVVPHPPASVEAIRLALLRHGRLRDASLVSVLAYAGLRPGEAQALRWSDVRERTILVERAVSLGELKSTKNEQLRTVGLLTPLRLDLVVWRSAVPARGGGDLVFASGRGGLWSAYDWDNWRDRIFRPAAREAGVGIGRPYDLRHSFASLLAHEGRSLVEVAHELGNSVAVASSTYTHVFAEADALSREPAALAIERAREALGVRQMYVELGLVSSADAPKTALAGEADARIRTADPFITSEVLYQLSYVGGARSV